MAETRSEKLVKDTLNREVANGRLLYYQNVHTSRYMSEPIDFVVVDETGATHLIEVKEGSESVGHHKMFRKIDQREILSTPAMQPDGGTGRTYAWVVIKLYNKDSTRASRNNFEYYFLTPGRIANVKRINFRDMLQAANGNWAASEDIPVKLIGQVQHNDWVFGGSKEYGLTTKGNETEGLESLLKNMEDRSWLS